MSRLLICRAEGGPAIGAGHVMRQLALATAWVERGGDVVLVADDAGPAAVGWKAVGSIAPAAALASVTADPRAMWLAIDGYALGAEAAGLPDTGPAVLLVDDHGLTGLVDAACVVDQNAGATGTPYIGLKRSPVLLGPRWALLRPDFDRETDLSDRGPIVVTMGAGVHGGQLPFAVRDRIAGVLSDFPIVVVDPAVPVADMVALLRSASVVVSAAGTTALEASALRRPMVLVAVADNQQPGGRALDAAGAARFVGSSGPGALDAIVDAVIDLLGDPEAASRMADRAHRLCDGRGARRAATVLDWPGLVLRDATAQDASLLHRWVNDPVVRASAFSPGAIAWEDHVRWFADRLIDPRCSIVIGERAGVPIGQVRIEQEPARHVVSVSLAAEARGLGLGPVLIGAAVHRFQIEQGPVQVTALVMRDNQPSRRSFDLAGWEQVGDDAVADHVTFRSPLYCP